MRLKQYFREGETVAAKEFVRTLRAIDRRTVRRPTPLASPHLFERRRIEQAIRNANGNLADAARDLGMKLALLSRKIRRFGLNR